MGWTVDLIRRIEGIVKVTSPLVVIGPVTIPGIGTGSAYASGDAFGVSGDFAAPKQGTIATARFYDYDKEGLDKELLLFSGPFTETADNSVFAPSDADLRNCVGIITFEADTWYSFSVNMLGEITPAKYYEAPKGRLWYQWITRGADNIAAGAIPDFSLVIV